LPERIWHFQNFKTNKGEMNMMNQNFKFSFSESDNYVTVGESFDFIDIDYDNIDKYVNTVNEISKTNDSRLMIDEKRSLITEGMDISGVETFIEYDGNGDLSFGAKRSGYGDQEPIIRFSFSISKGLIETLEIIIDSMKKSEFLED
jgi:hypothetical protein